MLRKLTFLLASCLFALSAIAQGDCADLVLSNALVVKKNKNSYRIEYRITNIGNLDVDLVGREKKNIAVQGYYSLDRELNKDDFASNTEFIVTATPQVLPAGGSVKLLIDIFSYNIPKDAKFLLLHVSPLKFEECSENNNTTAIVLERIDYDLALYNDTVKRVTPVQTPPVAAKPAPKPAQPPVAAKPKPTEPAKPTAPTTPAKPKPTQPTVAAKPKPAEPAKPTKPTTPAKPKPTQPTVAAKPKPGQKPAEKPKPAIAAKPKPGEKPSAKPSKPIAKADPKPAKEPKAKPAQPDSNAVAVAKTKPAKPAKPVKEPKAKPAKPDSNAVAVAKTKPAKPAKPAKEPKAKPAQPDSNAVAVAKTKPAKPAKPAKEPKAKPAQPDSNAVAVAKTKPTKAARPQKNKPNKQPIASIPLGEPVTANLDPEGCADLRVDSIRFTKLQKHKGTIRFTVSNIGSAPARIEGKTRDIDDDLSWKAYLSGDRQLNRGDIFTDGAFLSRHIKQDLIMPGETVTVEANIDMPKRTRFTAVLIIKIDAQQVLHECNEANNNASTIMR